MRTFGKIVLGFLVVIIVAAGGGYWWLLHTYPKVGPAPDLKVVATPELLQRGEYLARNVSNCLDCHSERDWHYFAGPLVPGSLGKGGEVFDEAFVGVPGILNAANITPFGVGSHTDGELYRTITTGVKKSGEPIFPLMPYPHYGRMADDDIKAIIAYIRTLPSVENSVPVSELDFPVNMIVRTIPKPASPQTRPDPSDEVAYGGYMVNAAACTDCHTPMTKKGERLMDLEFAGGFEFHFPNGAIARSANITPDSATGIGKWPKEQFIARFKKYTAEEWQHMPVDSTAFNTPMPWTLFAGMTEADLGAIYAFLRTVKPVNHQVEHFARETAAGY